MDKEIFRRMYEEIEVPKEDVSQAIAQGIRRAIPKKKKRKLAIIISAIAATLLLASGFVSPTMSQVFANVPLLGRLFASFEDSLGEKLASKELVTELNESITKNGVTVTLTSAYFDGVNVSITGHVKGKLRFNKGEEDEVSFDVNFDHNKGDADPWLGGSHDIRKKGDGYDFQMVLIYPYVNIKENFTLPMIIHYINGIHGEWNFDVPIERAPSKNIVLDKERQYENNGIGIHLRSITVGQASASLDVETSTVYKDDIVSIMKVTDDKGNMLMDYGGNHAILSESDKDNKLYRINRHTMSIPVADIKSLTFYPKLSISEPLVKVY